MTAEASGPRGRGRRGADAAGAGACVGPGGGGAGGGRYRRSVLEVAILASLADTTSHGYDLVERIGAMVGELVCLDSGTMYRMLRGMEEAGLVSSSWQTAEAGPSRRVYTISEQGLSVLRSLAVGLSERASALERLAAQALAAADRSDQIEAAT